jgi:hypothetical protein
MIKVANNIDALLNKKAAERMDGYAGSTPMRVGNSEFAVPDYLLYGGGGALAGAGIGALVNKLRGGSALKGGLIGSGIGAGAGLGARGLMDLLAYLRNSKNEKQFRAKEEGVTRRNETAKVMNLGGTDEQYPFNMMDRDPQGTGDILFDEGSSNDSLAAIQAQMDALAAQKAILEEQAANAAASRNRS